MSDLIPRRPTFFRSEWPAIPTTSTPNRSGAMITLMRRRKIVPRSCKLTASAGASWPNSAPARRPTKIQVVRERREVAYAAIRKIASQRSDAGNNAGSAKIGALTSSVTPIAIVAATAAATRNLFFIGARRIFSSVPKGILVGGICQWRPLLINRTAIPYAAPGPLLQQQLDDCQIQVQRYGRYSTRNALSGSMRVARRAGR